MFCPKCGAKSLDGAEFCQRCGAKLMIDTPAAQSAPEQLTNFTRQPGGTATGVPKKKSRKLPIILGITALAVILLIVLASIGSDKQPTPNDSGTVSLSQTYVNESEGISFKYPSGWVPVKEEDYDQYIDSDGTEILVALINRTDDLPEETSFISVRKSPATQQDADLISTSDENFAKAVEAQGISIKSTSAFELDGVPARKYTAVSSDGNGFTTYMYINGSSHYMLEFSWIGENPGSNQRFFDAIIDSYTITASASLNKPETSIPAETSDGLLFRGVPADQLIGASYDDMIQIFGQPDSTMYGGEENTYGDATIYFDMWSWENPYLCGISSSSMEDFTYNGRPLSENYDELSQLIGREPDDARVFSDTYSMTYHWDYMGSQAFLTVDTPATEDSDAAIEVHLNWWYSEENDDPAGNSSALSDGFEWIESPTGKTNEYSTTVSGIIQNTSQKTYSYLTISFNLYDLSGNQIGSASATIRDLQAGRTWKFEATGFVGNAAKFEFSSIDGF